MSAPEHIDEGEPVTAAERDLFVRIGNVRAEADAAEQTLARLRARHQDLLRQIDVVETECCKLEHELLERLSTWREFESDQQDMDDLLPQVRAVTTSFTYRVVAQLLRIVNLTRWVLTFGWLRRGSR
jgi:septal ring factor EnvC (AmiA/AmiB activator)